MNERTGDTLSDVVLPPEVITVLDMRWDAAVARLAVLTRREGDETLVLDVEKNGKLVKKYVASNIPLSSSPQKLLCVSGTRHIFGTEDGAFKVWEMTGGTHAVPISDANAIGKVEAIAPLLGEDVLALVAESDRNGSIIPRMHCIVWRMSGYKTITSTNITGRLGSIWTETAGKAALCFDRRSDEALQEYMCIEYDRNLTVLRMWQIMQGHNAIKSTGMSIPIQCRVIGYDDGKYMGVFANGGMLQLKRLLQEPMVQVKDDILDKNLAMLDVAAAFRVNNDIVVLGAARPIEGAAFGACQIIVSKLKCN